MGRSRLSLRRRARSLQVQGCPLRLLARARRLGSLEEEGSDVGALRIPRPTEPGSYGDGHQAASPTLCPTPKCIRYWDLLSNSSNLGPAMRLDPLWPPGTSTSNSPSPPTPPLPKRPLGLLRRLR